MSEKFGEKKKINKRSLKRDLSLYFLTIYRFLIVFLRCRNVYSATLNNNLSYQHKLHLNSSIFMNIFILKRSLTRKCTM